MNRAAGGLGQMCLNWSSISLQCQRTSLRSKLIFKPSTKTYCLLFMIGKTEGWKKSLKIFGQRTHKCAKKVRNQWEKSKWQWCVWWRHIVSSSFDSIMGCLVWKTVAAFCPKSAYPPTHSAHSTWGKKQIWCLTLGRPISGRARVPN